jgi:TolB-like protein/Tfp pilus assembly protein PilF
MAGSFIQELKRRNVFRVALVYIVVSWLLMQIGDVMFPALLLPEWTPTLLVAFLILGFPLVVLFAWAFELTPDGMVRTSEVPEEQSITAATGRKINYMIIGVLAIAVMFLLARDLLRPATTAPAEVIDTDHSIAVLPFKNQSASTENAEFFAGGLHDELLTLLSHLGDLRVISRTTVERLGPELTIPEIGEMLNVSTVLEGQVQRAGNRLRINVQLIDTTSEGHIWANMYDRELTAENIFDVQSDIARTITDALHAEISPADEILLGSVPTTNTAALENYLLGVQLWNRQSYGALSDAIGYLNEATTLDPDFAAAWVALAKAYTSTYQTGAITTEEFLAGAEPAVANAMRLDPLQAAAHTQQAVLQWARGDFVGAQQSFEQALSIDAYDSVAVGEYAFFLRNSARSEEAIPLVERALENDPLSTELLFQLGKAHMHAGRPERFLEITERIREIDPSVINGYNGATQAYLWMGEIDKALAWSVKSINFDPLDHENWAHLAVNLESLGDSVSADRSIQRAGELGPDEPVVLKCQVLIHLSRGQVERATAIAREALAANLDDRWGSEGVFLRAVRDAALQSGNVDAALDLYRERAPQAFEPDPVVAPAGAGFVLDAVALLQFTGDDDLAKKLLDQLLELYERFNPKHIRGYDLGIVDVEILALAGEIDVALQRLQAAVDGGWFLNWRYILEGRNLDNLKDRPEYQAIVAQLEAKQAEQSADWLATPHLGEFDPRDPSAYRK